MVEEDEDALFIRYCLIFPGRVVFDLVSIDIHELSHSGSFLLLFLISFGGQPEIVLRSGMLIRPCEDDCTCSVVLKCANMIFKAKTLLGITSVRVSK